MPVIDEVVEASGVKLENDVSNLSIEIVPWLVFICEGQGLVANR